MKPKELLGWILFLLFIGALLVGGYAFGPTVFQWVQQTRATANAPVENAEPVLSADVLSLSDSTHYDQKVAFCKTYTATFGKMGTFHGVYDSNMKTCVLGMWEEARLSPGMSLADLKIQGDEFSFLMPFVGSINHSANYIYVDGQECTPGNPVSCEGKTVFDKNTSIKVSTAAGNDSAGIMLIKKP